MRLIQKGSVIAVAKDNEQGSGGMTIRVLEADPDLGADLKPEDIATARDLAVADVIVVDTGSWSPPEGRGDLGFLVLEGALRRDVSLIGIGCTEILAKGDFIHVGGPEGDRSVPTEVDWTVLERTRLAVLDARFAAVIGRWPAIGTRLLGRAVLRAHTLAAHFAITCLVGLDQRIYAVFWLLADRFGRVGRDGILVPLPLTHETIAKLVAAKRPSVTTTLKKLREQDLLVPANHHYWLLRGDPREEIEKMRSARRERPDARL